MLYFNYSIRHQTKQQAEIYSKIKVPIKYLSYFSERPTCSLERAQ